jgi:hypothetical protein
LAIRHPHNLELVSSKPLGPQTPSGAALPGPLIPTGAEEQSLWAAFYLSKFDHGRLGMGNQGETFDKIAARLGVKRTTFKHRRDAFDAYTGGARKGWHQAALGQDLQRVFNKLKTMDERTLREIVLRFIRPSTSGVKA